MKKERITKQNNPVANKQSTQPRTPRSNLPLPTPQPLFPRSKPPLPTPHPLLPILITVLILSTCQYFIEQPQTPTTVINGFFSLIIEGAERTILPKNTQDDFAHYTLKFTPNCEACDDDHECGDRIAKTVPGTLAEVTQPIPLDIGVWDLVVTAYIDAAGTKPVARKSLSIQIVSGENYSRCIKLQPIEEGKGIFSWEIDFSDIDDSVIAIMTIYDMDWEVIDIYYFEDFEGEEDYEIIAHTDSIDTLDADTYRVVIELKDSAGRKIERREILHIYRNMDSFFEAEFLTAQFVDVYGISLSPSADKDFGEAAYDYEAQTPHSVTITNTGNQPTGELTIGLSGNDADSFSLSTTTMGSIAIGGEDDFTVTPNTGLGIRAYTATVTVTGGYGINKSFDVNFTVEIASVSIDETPQVVTYNVDAHEFIIIGVPDTGFNITYNQSDDDVTPINAGSYNVVITRAADGNYTEFSTTITNGLVIEKANPVVNWPDNLKAASWQQTLSSIFLAGNGTGTPGIFTWTNPGTVIENETQYPMKFTPDDTVNFNEPVELVTVNIVDAITSDIGIEMVWIPAGTFMMGSPSIEPNRGTGNTEFQHEVTLTKGFYMGIYLVTQEQWLAVMGGSNPSNFQSITTGLNTDRFPVEQVSWYDAIVFCNRLSIMEGLSPAYSIGGSANPDDWGAVPTNSNSTWDAVQIVQDSTGYRLPTEAQWEYACRAGTEIAFNWDSNQITSDQANFDASWFTYNGSPFGDWLSRTSQVGDYLPNAWGLYDMHGNVFEWCWDWFDQNYYIDPNAEIDPMGAVSGSYRVIRGGSWNGIGQYLRSAQRGDSNPWNRNDYYGFRLVRP